MSTRHFGTLADFGQVSGGTWGMIRKAAGPMAGAKGICAELLLVS